MLGLIFIYFVGKYFYELAGKHKKNQWGFAILGVASYYIGLFSASLLLGLVIGLVDASVLDGIPDIALGLLALPFGLLTCWGTYKFLENQWIKSPPTLSSDILDGDLTK